MPTVQPAGPRERGEETVRFTVDTHLFRELGLLLVGRDSTALVELIKNAYDADAREVVVDAIGLASGDGEITITDDGTGMTFETFRDVFLRIAGRSKESGDRRSKLYGRRFTGAKGIGRLSAHKLAHRLEVVSRPRVEGSETRDGVIGRIRWDAIETNHELLEQVGGEALSAKRLPVGDLDKHGTDLRLVGLRRAWTSRERNAFIREVRSARPPAEMLSVPENLKEKPLILGPIKAADTKKRIRGGEDPGFDVVLRGDLEPGDSIYNSLHPYLTWIVELDARGPMVEIAIAPTEAHRRRSSGVAERYLFSRGHPNPGEGPFFTARIYVREDPISNKSLRTMAREQAGVRVYLEGFRVLPYGEPSDDWLRINRDYSMRAREYNVPIHDGLGSLPEEGLVALTQDSYFGAVFLTENSAPSLEMVVNREGFVPNRAWGDVTELVRNAIDLSVRVRAHVNQARKEEQEQAKRAELAKLMGPATQTPGPQRTTPDIGTDGSGAVPESPAPADERMSRLLGAANDALKNIRARGVPVAAREDVQRTSLALDALASELSEVRDERAMLRVLASVGTQFAAFVHEVTGLLGQAQTVRALLDDIAASPSFNNSDRRALAPARAGLNELIVALERQASYLADVVGADARRRRQRLKVADRLNASLRLLDGTMARRNITIEPAVPSDLRTPPMFPAELSVVLTNLLTNAIKAAGDGGRIAVTGAVDPDASATVIRVENTGIAVDPEAGEQWFAPFASTTTDVDVVLGQGMGLGLPISRRVIADYGGTVRFVRPRNGYATGVEVRLPDSRRSKGRT